MRFFFSGNVFLFLWPLLLMFAIGLLLTFLFLTIQKFRSFKGLFFVGLPGFTFLVFSLISIIVSYTELNDVDEKFKRDSIKQIQVATPAILRSIKQGQYIDLGPQLTDLALKAHFANATISLVPQDILVATYGNQNLQNFPEAYSLRGEDVDGSSVLWGHLKWQWDSYHLNQYMVELRYQWMRFSAIIFGVTALLTVMLSSYLFRYLKNSSALIHRLSIAMKESSTTDGLVKNVEGILSDEEGLFEEVTLKKNIQTLVANMTQMSQTIARQQTHAALGKLAGQVAHDVRSPLSAIKVVAHGGFGLNPDAQKLLKDGCERVEEIMKDLKSHVKVELSEFDRNQVVRDEVILTEIEKIISEKRILFPDIKFQMESDIEISQTAKLNQIEFSRVLSNLINNAAEAMSKAGTIKVRLDHSDSFLNLTIIDQGPGISEERLSKLGARGATFDKAGGTGLGLWHAKNSVELWGGNFKIESKVGLGTQVQVSLLK